MPCRGAGRGRAGVPARGRGRISRARARCGADRRASVGETRRGGDWRRFSLTSASVFAEQREGFAVGVENWFSPQSGRMIMETAVDSAEMLNLAQGLDAHAAASSKRVERHSIVA